MKNLKVTEAQLTMIRQLKMDAQNIEGKLSTYLGAILDQHSLKGIWNVVGITDKGIQVEKK